jgi:hypothetical protein
MAHAFRGTPRQSVEAGLAWRQRPVHADQAVGVRSLYLADDEHGLDRVVGGAVGDAARRLRVAGNGAQPEAGAGRLIRILRDHAGVVGRDATACVIMMALCGSISRPCPTIRMSLRRMLREVVPELQAENEKLWQLIQRLQRHRYGPRSEKLDLDQLQLVLEDAEQIAAERPPVTQYDEKASIAARRLRINQDPCDVRSLTIG